MKRDANAGLAKDEGEGRVGGGHKKRTWVVLGPSCWGLCEDGERFDL